MHRMLDAETEAKVTAEYLGGESSKAVAKRWGVNYQTVLNTVRRCGGEVRTQCQAAVLVGQAKGQEWGSLPPERVKEAAEMYLAGATIRQAAAAFGVNFKTMQVSLRKFGVEFRKPARTYQVNDGAFDEPTAEACYFAGLLYADGCVSTSCGKRCIVKLGLSGEDGGHVRTFAAFLETTYPVATVTNLGGLRAKPSTQLVVRSERMVIALSRYGVVPNKSLTASTPEFLRSNPDWWRGVVDGDGWVRLTNSPRIGLCGSEATVRQFSEYAQGVHQSLPCDVRANGYSENNWRTEIAGRRALAVIRSLYGHGGPALPRKAATAAEIIKRFANESDHEGRCLRFTHKHPRKPR